LLVIAGLTCAPGCGGDGGQPTTTTETTATAPRVTSAPRPPLPRGWRRIVNARAGFSFAVPAGWRSHGGSGTTFVRSRDNAVACSVLADRSSQGRSSGNPGDYATRATRALASSYRGLRLRGFERLGGAIYPTSVMRASGVFKRTGVRQEITLAVIRVPGQVTYTMLCLRNARTRASVYHPVIKRMIRSFRAQPPRF
jgi:hypothetical protein